jgi:hypothetical protein
MPGVLSPAGNGSVFYAWVLSPAGEGSVFYDRGAQSSR